MKHKKIADISFYIILIVFIFSIFFVASIFLPNSNNNEVEPETTVVDKDKNKEKEEVVEPKPDVKEENKVEPEPEPTPEPEPEPKPEPKVEEPKPKKIVLEKNKSSIDIGSDYQIKFTTDDDNLTFRSSDESVAIVDSLGNITAKKKGQAIITIETSDGQSVELKIEVNDPEIKPTSIKLNVTKENLFVGEKVILRATIEPEDATNQTIKWTSSDSNVAPVSYGTVNAKSAGKATITATTSNGLKATAEIVVDTFKLNETTTTLIEGDKHQIKYTSSLKNITFKSNDSSIASVDAKGNIEAKKVGNTIIILESGNKKLGEVKVTVKKKIIEPSNITLNASNVSLLVGRTYNLTATVSPSNATDKTVTWMSSNNNIATVQNGVVTAKGEGTVTISALTSNLLVAEAKFTITEEVKSYFDIYFLNTYNNTEMTGGNSNYVKAGGQSFIVRTSENKYVLIDTSYDEPKIQKYIYNQMKSLQNKSKVTIDYLFISHAHNDHVGGALNLLNNSNITFNKLIMKNEVRNKTIYKNVSKKFSSSNIVKLTSEGMKIDLDKNVEMYFFNVADVYKDNYTKCKKGYYIKFTSKSSAAKKINGKYYYFDGSNFPTVKIVQSSSLKKKNNGGINKYYYAYTASNRDSCNTNANTIALLFKIKTNKGNRYVYIPSDIYNNGYELGAVNGYFGNYTSTIFNSISDISYSSSKHMFTGNVKPIKVPSETKAAKAIKNQFGNDLNIVIYQSAHHGINNAPDAISILNINNNNVYSYTPTKSDPSTSTSFLTNRSYFYTLKNTKRYYGGGTSKKGTHCNVNNNGTYACAYY